MEENHINNILDNNVVEDKKDDNDRDLNHNSTNNLIEENKKPTENKTDNMFTFGEEDLDVPTFLRNNN